MASPTLTEFWNDTRLHSRPEIAAPSPPSEPWSPGRTRAWSAAAEVLCLGYGERSGAVITKGRELMRARTSPSAGALYPFEVFIAFAATDTFALYRYDVVGSCLKSLATIRRQHLTALLALPEDSEVAAVVAVVGRPGISMIKYGIRGYRYTHLDSGHATANIAIAAERAGYRAQVHLRFSRSAAADLLGVDKDGWEPYALMTLRPRPDGAGAGDREWVSADMANPFAVPIWRHDLDTAVDSTGPREREMWRLVSPISTYSRDGAGPRPGARLSVTGGEGGATAEAPDAVRLDHPPPSRSTLRDLTLRRRSAKGFLGEPVGLDALGRALGSLRDPIAVDCVDGPAVGARLLVRRVSGLAAGVYAYDPAAHALRPAGDGDRDDDEIVSACMNQGVVRGAAAVVALHAPVQPLLRELGVHGLAELHFHAACAAQHLCLGATAQAFDITCIGGFDSTMIGRLVRLPSSEEVVYVLALGIGDELAVKWDRAPIAHSHGGRPR